METDLEKMDINTLKELAQNLYVDLTTELGDRKTNLLLFLEAERELTKREMIK